MPLSNNTTGPETILLVDDDQSVLRSLDRGLRENGFLHTVTCSDPRDVERIVLENDVDIVLLDLIMPHKTGEEMLALLAGKVPKVPVIVITARNEVDTAVRCIQQGAFDYLVKPLDLNNLVRAVTKALHQHRLVVENNALRKRILTPSLSHPEWFADVITDSPIMFGMFSYIEAIACSPEPVLIVGETGVGKELVAHAIHRASHRPGALVCVNAAGINDETFADALFGHVRGAYTGADRDREGLILKAGDGTLLLDEIGDVGVETQTKLLRLIQEGEFYPVGSDICRKSRCRIIAATNRDLRVRMQEGLFREDLYWRLHSHLIRVPPLRERPGDIPLLAAHFLKNCAETLGKTPPTAPRELFTHLSVYSYPGNIRELRGMMLEAVACHTKGVLSLKTFHDYMKSKASSSDGNKPQGDASLAFGKQLPTVEKATQMLIQEALTRSNGNQVVAARLLGISRRTVNRYSKSED